MTIGGKFGREQLVEANGHQFLVYARLEVGAPTIVFLPGGAHLARVAYGHPGAREADFLDDHLRVSGLGLLAISYPSSHPVFTKADPLMTLAQWAEGVATLCSEFTGGGPVLVAGWSMAGKIAFRLSRALKERGIPLTGFVALAARPPWPGLSPRRPEGEPVRADGFWDSNHYDPLLAEGVEEANRLAGRVVISPEERKQFYCTSGPLMLRGEVDRLAANGPYQSLDAALQDSDGFAFQHAPLCATISPTRPTDPEQALAGAAFWNAIALTGLMRNHLAGLEFSRLSPHAWDWLRTVAQSWHTEMNYSVEGGHFFFVGEQGAKATAEALFALNGRLSDISVKLNRLRLLE
ncbi:hypothetical protein G6M85_21430 [Agrobacterium tumefaciens]|nr:hypothetical protein [Agrobacterium tumefaciens]